MTDFDAFMLGLGTGAFVCLVGAAIAVWWHRL